MKKAVKYSIIGAFGALSVINAVRAARFTPKKTDRAALPDEITDVENACAHLSGAISIPTVSYPEKDNVDFSQFDRFHAYLDETYPLIRENLEKELIEEANLIYRWKGSRSDLDPIALLSHQDVVPVSEKTESDWMHPPFSGFNDGEFIWGRGALDMKNHLIGVMEAVESLLAEGFAPERDVYLLFGQDEEVSMSDSGGAHAMMETLRARGIHLDCVIDEGGVMLPVDVKGVMNHKCLCGVGIAEKGYADIEISVHAKGGHSSQPPKHSAIGELAAVIRKLERKQFKAEMPPFLMDMLKSVGRNCTYPLRLLTCNIPLLKPVLKIAMTQIPLSASMMRTTTAVTMLSGSPAANVLPQKATATVNFRMMPGVSSADVINHIHRCAKRGNVEIHCLKKIEASAVSHADSRAFQIIEALCMQESSDHIVVPYLVMYGTDACAYEPICENIYRFSPFKAGFDLMLCAHATNERIPVSSIGPAITFFKRYIRKASAE
ncbi:MAG: M20/M25/M40 family metallo-hydrolase [Clostridia bacterium]|nr:M20/M25/M40 family metallo-hydrolase [Clostridia bacterium]